MKGESVVWVLTELYFPEETSTGYIMTEIAEGISVEFKTKVICAQPTYSLKKKIAPWSETKNGVEIKRCIGVTLDRHILLLRIVNALSLSLLLGCLAMLKVRSNDIILVVTNPPLLPFCAAVVAFLRRARLVILIHDVYPDVLIASGLCRTRSIAIRLLETASAWLYEFANKVIVIGRDMERLVLEKTKNRARNVAFIPNWAEIDANPGVEGDRRLLVGGTNFSDSALIVLYGGNMGRTHGIEDLVSAAELLSRASADILLVFIGDGAKRAWLERAVLCKGLKNVLIKPSCSRAEFSGYLHACDIGLISFVTGMSGVSVPSRMYNIMAAGKAILAVTDEESELARIVTKERAGVLVPPSRPDRLAAAMMEAAENRSATKEMGLRGRAAVLRSFTKEKVITSYRLLIKSLVCDSSLHKARV